MLQLFSLFWNRKSQSQIKQKLKSHEKVRIIKNQREIVMPSEKDNILEFNIYMKSDKMPYVIYAAIKSLIRKIGGCANNPENSSAIKVGNNIPCGYSMSTILSFYHVENKHTL